jgi:nitrate reductase beta subunit
MLFGPGAVAAQQAYRAAMEGGDDELLGVLLLALASDRIVTRYSVRAGVAVGWNDAGDEVARVPLREPVVVRPAYDRGLNVYRYNVP